MSNKSPIVKFVNENGNMLSITLRVEDKEEQKIFRSLIEGDMQVCPYCGDPIKVGEDDMMITFDNPLMPPAFMKLATPSIICDKCKKTITLSMVDYTPFAKEEGFLINLRKEYERRQNANKKG